MSLILDALNRSRDDDAVSVSPNLATDHSAGMVAPPYRYTVLWIALGACVILLVWLLVERFSAAEAPSAHLAAPAAVRQNDNRVIEPAAAATVSGENSAKVTQVAEPAVVQESGAGRGITATRIAEHTANNGTAADADAAITSTLVRSTADQQAVAALYRNKNAMDDLYMAGTESGAAKEVVSRSVADPPVTDSITQRDEQPINIEDVLQRAQSEAGNAALEEHPAPFLSRLSQQVKDGIPTIYYQRHDYFADVSDSSVVLNGKKAVVGDSPITGLRVDEILKNSVVLSFRGTQFRLRALNSWINL